MKNAELTLELKADSGYESNEKVRISSEQWRLLLSIVHNEKYSKLFLKENMIDFGIHCMEKLRNQENGTVYDYYNEFINNDSIGFI